MYFSSLSFLLRAVCCLLLLTSFNAYSHSLANTERSKPVIIIGAGAAGLTAGYLLHQKGIAFTILEASDHYGGRMKHTTDFTDFPIPLGAEWMHIPPTFLGDIVNDDSVTVDISTSYYNPDHDTAYHDGEEIDFSDAGMNEDSKFIRSSWLDFYSKYIVPSIKPFIHYNTVVSGIDYAGSHVKITSSNGKYEADKVIVTVPVKTLQMGHIRFKPALPKAKQKAINDVVVWDGLKAFIEFKNAFYPTLYGLTLPSTVTGEKLYYDAAYGQDSSSNVLGLFVVGSAAAPYISLSDDALIATVLEELDALSDGEASANYIQHTVQNWSKTPYIHGAYIRDDEHWKKVAALGRSVKNKVYFAGTAYTEGEDWGSVHTAAQSAKRVVEQLY